MGRHTIAVVGGTGPQGKGLALHFARAGREVVIGSRSAERAEEAAQEIRDRIGPGEHVRGLSNATAVQAAGVVVLAVPWDGHKELVRDLAPYLAGKLVISCVNPLGFDKRGAYGLDVEEGSAAEQTQQLVPDAVVVGAFHHLSAVSLWDAQGPLEHEDVLVVGDDRDAKEQVAALAATITGRSGVDGGALRLARQLEPLTAVLIGINRRYKTRSGVSISGIPA
ncbi:MULTISPECIES: NADPH-dependent F420 reductase [unclassified Streptomyces]|uniref:NADPH-dependent F420 reductase n=1 Tax=unclassified Streptomyces TaxID=2593676 RepID=UPI002256C50C|nr:MULTISPECIES: NADPH-dependent F420 reductase [unclassified Streptomyces]MCX5285597.1 NADPH-dependent F420 reductase [Streptomyces sp. NBC_00198]